MTGCWFLNLLCCLRKHLLRSNAMKKYIAFVLAVFCLCLSACGSKEITDGVYTIEVELIGGTGRATVESPATVVIKEGEATATIRWSSPFYEYMMVGQTRYDPIQEDGNSTFQIPVVFDEDMTVSASTIAMSQPYLIDYTLHFDSSTLEGE